MKYQNKILLALVGLLGGAVVYSAVLGVSVEEIKAPSVTSTLFTMTDNDNSGDGNYVAVYLGPDNEAHFVVDPSTGTEQKETFGVFSDNSSLAILMDVMPTEEKNINVVYSATPTSSVALHVERTDARGNARFIASLPGAVSAVFQDDQGNYHKVFHDANPTHKGSPVYFAETALSGERFRYLSTTDSSDLWVTGQGGSVVHLAVINTYTGEADVGFDATTSTLTNRILANTPSLGNSTDDTVTVFGTFAPPDYSGVIAFPLYYDEDGTNKLLHNNADFAYDVYAKVFPNNTIKIAYSATASSTGVTTALYNDLWSYVSPTNANSTFGTATDITISQNTYTELPAQQGGTIATSTDDIVGPGF